MAYRRRQPPSRMSTFPAERIGSAPVPGEGDRGATASSPPAIAAQAIRASAAHRDASSLSSAYGEPAVSSPRRDHLRPKASPPNQDSSSYEYTSINSLNESKYGFWGLLARKAKQFIDDDNGTKQFQAPGRNFDTSTSIEFDHPYQSHEYHTKRETTHHKSSDALASSLKDIGGTIKNAIEGGLSKVENKTADIIQETRKLNIRRKGSGTTAPSQVVEKSGQHLPHIQTDYETQLKASRDVANAMAAKAKLLLRELKTVKADLAFAKERCAQLEEENKMLRESHEKGDGPEDDDLIRLQLETLLSEKARLAHENSVYARENRFLREIVEYHQLTMQDVVYVDEGIEDVSEVYSSPIALLSSPNIVSETSVTSAPSTPTRVHKNNAVTQPQLSPSSSIVLPEDCPILPVPSTPLLSTDPPKGR